MSTKKCARCEKTVYPIEELKCLDKIWHKLCFKCQVCNMTLNMKSYKGFDKQPYCEAHIPKVKATTMAETPELKRIAENTKIQSNVKYHAEFERSKGKFTQVADDPETLRIKQNSKIISNVAYHGDLEKKKAMEERRTVGENGDEEVMPPPPPIATDQTNSPYQARQSSTLIYTSDRGPVSSQPTRQIGSIADFDPVNECYGSIGAANHNHHQPVAPNHNSRGKAVYRALYDYDAQDSDEVSFLDGDLIVDCSPIDAGWMTGVVQRTGRAGMLPANYVELVE